MDVGYGGLNGENTTDFLRMHFKNIDGLCKDEKAVVDYQVRTGAQDEVYIGIYPQRMPNKTYDLLVLDPNIEGNLAFWSHEGMKRAWGFVNDGGAIITYIMTTDEYGDPETHELLKQHRKDWWENGGEVKIANQEREERRDYIIWVLLKKP